jgi:hypothetical protein
MSRIKTEKLHEFLVSKELKYSVRLTSYAHGDLKKVFLCDCIQRECNESKMINLILESYYSNPANKPSLNEKQLEYFRKLVREEEERKSTELQKQIRIDWDKIEDNPIKDYINNKIKLE